MRKTKEHDTITIHNLTLISQGDYGTVIMNGDNSTQVVDGNYKRLYQVVKQENEWLRDYSNKLMSVIIKQSEELKTLRSINQGGKEL